MLGEDDIQGKKSGFLAGNKVYYIGGKYEVQRCTENETIGLNHPMYHDLRSRGTGIASFKGVGTGNDFEGWEFHRATQVAAGNVITPNHTWTRPPPTRMFWRPDKMIVEYELASTVLNGVFDGWCSNWTQLPGGDTTASVWQTLPGWACNNGHTPLFETKVSVSADEDCEKLCQKTSSCVEWQVDRSSNICWGYGVKAIPAKNVSIVDPAFCNEMNQI